jgi:hypothetical protein
MRLLHRSRLALRAWAGALGLTTLAAAPPVPSASGGPERDASKPLADSDPTNDYVVAPPDPIADCEGELTRLGVHYGPASLPLRPGRRGVPVCGTTQAVVYRGGPERIRYGSAPIVSCGMALALSRFETVLNTEARRTFGEPVVRIEHLGTYNCRKMARYPDWVSEHSYANAIDISSFTLKSGRTISVLGSFGRFDREPRRTEAHFLDRVSHRLYDEDIFSVVITPAFDALHKNHFHLDLARYRVNGTSDT